VSPYYSGWPFPSLPTYSWAFEEDFEYYQELQKLLFDCEYWGLASSSESDFWQPDDQLQRLLSEYGLDGASELNNTTASFRVIFGRPYDAM
jgi:hypothetical protein